MYQFVNKLTYSVRMLGDSLYVLKARNTLCLNNNWSTLFIFQSIFNVCDIFMFCYFFFHLFLNLTMLFNFNFIWVLKIISCILFERWFMGNLSIQKFKSTMVQEAILHMNTITINQRKYIKRNSYPVLKFRALFMIISWWELFVEKIY